MQTSIAVPRIPALAAALVALGAWAASAQAPAPGDASVVQMDRFIKEAQIDKTGEAWKQSLPRPPELAFDAAREYLWHLETNQGHIVIRLMPEVAPMHVSSTIYLTRLDFYDGTKFHRVIPGFMAQGGDPRGDGTGGPGYTMSGEFDEGVKHDRPGLLSMANRGPGTDGSQFFITFGPAPWLDGKHTIFGEVVEGMGTLKKLEARGSAGRGVPREPLILEEARIRVQPEAGAPGSGGGAASETGSGDPAP